MEEDEGDMEEEEEDEGDVDDDQQPSAQRSMTMGSLPTIPSENNTAVDTGEGDMMEMDEVNSSALCLYQNIYRDITQDSGVVCVSSKLSRSSRCIPTGPQSREHCFTPLWMKRPGGSRCRLHRNRT